MIKRLKPFPGPIQVPETPSCDAHVMVNSDHERDWRLSKGQTEPFVCSRPSVVEIEGKNYCRLHGGHVALDMYLEGRLVEK